MLDKKIVASKICDFAMNYDIEPKDGYVAFICKTLNEKGFDDAMFVKAIDSIMENETSLFNKMPNLAMFLKYGGVKTLTDEQKNVQRASEVMVWLSGGCNYNTWMDKPKWVWDGYEDHYSKYYKIENPYNKLVEDKVIFTMISEHFGGSGGIIERFLEQKNTGYTELFRKELIEFMRISEVTVDDTLMIESDEDTVKKIEGCIGMITDKFKTNRSE